MTAPRRPLLLPASLAQRFEAVGVLGRGAMGQVLRVRERSSGRELALKLLIGPLNKTQLARFRREGQVTAALRHPGIVAVHSAGDANGIPFLAYELVEGDTLSDAWRRAPQAKRVAWIAEIARAVGHAHSQGVVHRDLKPANVLVDSRGSTRVLDFGVATARDLDRLTRTGALVGTPLYMSPEQAAGQPVTPTSDVWSLGVILYEALTDRPPFEAANLVELVCAIAGEDPVRPTELSAEISADLERICLRCLDRDQAQRYETAQALADDLDRHLRGERISRDRSLRLGQLTGAAGVLLGAGLLVGAIAWGVSEPTVTVSRSAADTQRDRARRDRARHRQQESARRQAEAQTASAQRAVTVAEELKAGGSLSAAIDVLEAELRQAPADSVAAGGLSRRCAELRLERASGIRRSETAAAREDVERALVLQPDNLEALLLLGKLASRSSAGSDPAEQSAQRALAVRSFKRATELDPSNVTAWAGLGGAHERSDDAAAIQAWTRALSLDPDLLWALASRARVYQRVGKIKLQLADLNRYLELRPRDPVILSSRGNSKMRLGDSASALADADLALSIREEPRAYLLRAMVFHRKGLYAQAVPAAEAALQLDPALSAAGVILGECHYLLDRSAEALRVFERVLQTNPNDSDALRGKGNTLRYLKRFDEAGVWLRKARAQATDTEQRRQCAESLQSLADSIAAEGG